MAHISVCCQKGEAAKDTSELQYLLNASEVSRIPHLEWLRAIYSYSIVFFMA